MCPCLVSGEKMRTVRATAVCGRLGARVGAQWQGAIHYVLVLGHHRGSPEISGSDWAQLPGCERTTRHLKQPSSPPPATSLTLPSLALALALALLFILVVVVVVVVLAVLVLISLGAATA